MQWCIIFRAFFDLGRAVTLTIGILILGQVYTGVTSRTTIIVAVHPWLAFADHHGTKVALKDDKSRTEHEHKDGLVSVGDGFQKRTESTIDNGQSIGIQNVELVNLGLNP
jgi:hypothetical protein